MDDMERKGNMRYVEHYLTYFDDYIGFYVWGSHQRERIFGSTTFICAGTGHGWRDLLMSPWRVYRAALQRGATHFLTADLVFGWWHALFVRLLMRAKIVVMPVCTPSEIFKNSGRTYSGYPLGLERFLISLTFATASRILVNAGSFPNQRWVGSLWCRNKMVVVDAIPEELSSPEFIAVIERLGERVGALRERTSDTPLRLIYVGRLEQEKLVGDLIEIANALKLEGLSFEMVLIGDGTERAELESRVNAFGISDRVTFLGFRQAADVAFELARSDIFISTLTGTALKEASFARLAIVSYAIDYIADIYTHGENCLLAPGGSISQMTSHVVTLARDPNLRAQLALNGYDFVSRRWSRETVRIGLEHAFKGL
jgi:glycosyltransferase involved in cell wall biosynthesis